MESFETKEIKIIQGSEAIESKLLNRGVWADKLENGQQLPNCQN